MDRIDWAKLEREAEEKQRAADAEWHNNFNSMKVTGTCDAGGCKNPATTWFGSTNCATCGKADCIEDLQYNYDNG
tara:strand:+ start:929 stop:1153 length:225 start_codon:yes stop_codon:yes gene_type:complete